MISVGFNTSYDIHIILKINNKDFNDTYFISNRLMSDVQDAFISLFIPT